MEPPNLDHEAFVDDVVAQRQNGVNASYFSSILKKWKSCILEYEANRGNPEIVIPCKLFVDNSTPFHTLYLNPANDSVQKPILQNLRDRTMQLCPSCGEAGTPNTLDHYLPKNIYPEYCIFSLNLSPMCDICQGEKGALTLDCDGKKIFIHPYYDDFSSNQLMKMTISPPFNSPSSCCISPHPSIPSEYRGLVERHLNQLNIQSRFARFFQNEYIRLLRLSKFQRDSGQDIRQNLDMFKRNELLKSVNSWLYVFYDGVLDNAELLEYLELGELPEHL